MKLSIAFDDCMPAHAPAKRGYHSGDLKLERKYVQTIEINADFLDSAQISCRQINCLQLAAEATTIFTFAWTLSVGKKPRPARQE